MISKSFIKKLREESKLWVSDGLMDESQRNRIFSRYACKLEYGRLINTIITLGSILVGLGILLFVASNWDKLGKPAKICIIFGVVSFFNLAGYYFRYVKTKYPGLGEGFLLIGSFAFGAGIWLVAQMYHIHYNFSAGILFWFLGIIPLVCVLRLWTILSLSSILAFIWLVSYNIYYFNRTSFGFFILAVVIVLLAYLRNQRFPLFVMIIAMSQWFSHFWMAKVNFNYNRMESSFLSSQLLLAAIHIIYGFVLYALGVWHQRLNRFVNFSFLFKFFGLFFITFSTYSLTFAHHYYKNNNSIRFPADIMLLILILFILAGYIIKRLSLIPMDKFDKKEIESIFLLLLAQLIVFPIAFSYINWTSFWFNIILLVEAIIFMYVAFIKHSEGLFRLAIVVFFIDILSRYFDIFWKMMDRSLLFILGGIILILGAIFANRKRIEIERLMHEDKSV